MGSPDVLSSVGHDFPSLAAGPTCPRGPGAAGPGLQGSSAGLRKWEWSEPAGGGGRDGRGLAVLGRRLLRPAVEKARAFQRSSPAPVTGWVGVAGWVGGEYLPRNPLQIQLRSLAFLEMRPGHVTCDRCEGLRRGTQQILGFPILGEGEDSPLLMCQETKLPLCLPLGDWGW